MPTRVDPYNPLGANPVASRFDPTPQVSGDADSSDVANGLVGQILSDTIDAVAAWDSAYVPGTTAGCAGRGD